MLARPLPLPMCQSHPNSLTSANSAPNVWAIHPLPACNGVRLIFPEMCPVTENQLGSKRRHSECYRVKRRSCIYHDRWLVLPVAVRMCDLSAGYRIVERTADDCCGWQFPRIFWIFGQNKRKRQLWHCAHWITTAGAHHNRKPKRYLPITSSDSAISIAGIAI